MFRPRPASALVARTADTTRPVSGNVMNTPGHGGGHDPKHAGTHGVRAQPLFVPSSTRPGERRRVPTRRGSSMKRKLKYSTLAVSALTAGGLLMALGPAASSAEGAVARGDFHAFAAGAGQDIGAHAQLVRR